MGGSEDFTPADPAVRVARQLTSAALPPGSDGARRVSVSQEPELTDSALAKQLYAAKPVTWRGKGDLLQCPWTVPLHGTWLIIDLWSGIGGLPLSLLSIGVNFYCVSAETDPSARAACHQVMPNIVHVEDVQQVHATDFVLLLRRRKPRGVLIGGGSPCQGNSLLNKNRLGLDDPRSQQPLELVRIRDEFRSLPEMDGVELLSLLENVASMQKPVRDQYSEWLECLPVELEAVWCGWVRRRRLFWLCGSKGGLCSSLSPPVDWQWRQSAATLELRYIGKKPIPAKVAWEGGYQPLVSPAAVLQGNVDCAFHTFTREFFHPEDRVSMVDPPTAARFYEDDRRFPPGAYSEHSLVWRGSAWRQPTPAERCQLMGIPPAAVSVQKGPSNSRTQTSNSFVGNGFHIPCVLAVLCFIPQLLASKIPPPWTACGELDLYSRLEGTVWEPERLSVFPDLLEAEEVVRHMQVTFARAPVQPEVWSDVLVRLKACRLWKMQYFAAWMRLRGANWVSLGPTPIAARDRARIYAGLSGQRFPADSGKGLDHLLPPGLTKEGHMSASLDLPSPFAPSAWPELDISYVVEALGVWREFLPRFAAEQRQVLETIARAVAPLDTALQAFKSPSALQVASQKRPAVVAVLTALLRWPDTSQAWCLVEGYKIIGDFPSTGLFRPVAATGDPSLSDWQGQAAIDAVDTLIRRGPPLHHHEILEITQAEQKAQFCGPFVSRKFLDDLYGEGEWRPLERFLITQQDGKQRVIDNARKTGHNAHTSMVETITTVNVDCVASFARMVCDHLAIDSQPADRLPWLSLRLATDDLPDAYRGLPVHPDHMKYSYIAIYTDHQWQFTPLYGLAYGLESAVINFNRLPQLGVAAARRICASFAAAYFDDELSVEFCSHAAVSNLGLKLVFTLMGVPPQPAKAFHPGSDRHYLGTSVHVGAFASDGTIRFQPKSLTTAKVLKCIDGALADATMDRDTAGKLRGDLNWMFSNCAGQVGKFAGPLLTKLQHSDSTSLDKDDLDTLRILRLIVSRAEPRDIRVCGPTDTTLRVYSDASFENGVLRLGWVCFPRGQPACGGTCVVPQAVIDSWVQRQQQIFPGETLCGLVVPWYHPHLFSRQDVIWFIDNEAAAACLIRGSSKQSDVHLLAQFSTLQFHVLQCRVWVEWIDSESNPSDGLSREGLSDPWTVFQGWQTQEFEYPEELLPQNFLSSFERSLDLF